MDETIKTSEIMRCPRCGAYPMRECIEFFQLLDDADDDDVYSQKYWECPQCGYVYYPIV